MRRMAMSEQSGRGQRRAEDESGTHSACTSHRCSSWTGAPCPHSPSPRFWVSERCILSSSSGCTLSHRWTTYSTLSTGRPLARNRQGRMDGRGRWGWGWELGGREGGADGVADEMEGMRIAQVGGRRCDPETGGRKTHVKVGRDTQTQSLITCFLVGGGSIS